MSIQPIGATLKPGVIQFLTQAAFFSTWTFIVIVAREELSLNDTAIAYVAAVFSATNFISSYFFGRASDYYGRRIFLYIGLLSSAGAFLLQIVIWDFWSYLGFRMLTGVCMGIFPAALIAYVHESKRKLGGFSSYGAMGWLVGMLVSGFLANFLFLRSVFIFSSILFVISFAVALKLPPLEHKPIKVPLFPKHIIKKNLAVYLGILIRHSGAHLMWVFWPLFLLSLGADFLWVGIIQAINASTQFVIMFFITDKIKSELSIFLGLFLSGVTFFSFTLAQDYIQLLPTQVFLGMSWAFMYVGALRYINERSEEHGTATGILNSVISISSVIGSMLAIVIISILGDYRGVILVATAMAFAGLILFSILVNADKKNEMNTKNESPS
jgi:DHA1 family quinolone resistance protein-like MFS transporter